MSAHRWQCRSDSPDSTLRLGSTVARHMQGGTVLGLTGGLGAGKTLFVRGLADANAGRPCEVTSPTFTLVQEYPGRLTIYHLDVYRLSRTDDPLLLAVDEMIRDDSAVVIEWAERVEHMLPEDMLWIRIEPSGEFSRIFQFEAKGRRSQHLLQDVQAHYVDTSPVKS